MSSDATASTDKFLFLFKPQVDDKCVFGISLKIAVRIVSVFLILVSLSEFFEAFSQNKLWVLLWNIFFAIFFLSIAIFAFLSTINDKYEYANISNIVYSIVFIIKFLSYLVKVVFLILGFVNPFGESFFKIKGVWSLVGEGAYLLLLLYFVYILYCFTVHLK